MKQMNLIRILISSLLLLGVLNACTSEVSLIHPGKIAQSVISPQLIKSLDNQEALKVFKPEPVFIQQQGPVGTIKSDGPVKEVQGVKTKDLTISMNFGNNTQTSDGFKTQALRCADFVKLKVQITGIGIASPLFPAGVDGNNNIDASAGCTIAATIANVPFGNVRIASVAAFEADGTTLIPGSVVKAVFNVSADPTNVNIGYNTSPTATAIAAVVAGNDFIGAYIVPGTLQAFVDTETGVSGTFPNLTYTYHPSLIDSAQLGADLLGNGGNVGGLSAGDYDNEAFSTVTGTLAGLLGTDTASIQVTDPASPISINNGNGGFSFTSNVKNGTWVVHAENPKYTADVQPATTIAAGGSDDVGTITFTWANTPNITGLSSSAEPIGTSIQINGTDFHPEIAGNAVTFNGVTATVTAASSTQLTVTVPNATDGNVVVTVGTVASNGVNFDVMPTVNITAPAAAAVVNGASSAITTNFTSGNSVTQVEFFLDGTGGTSLGTDGTGPTYTLNWDTTAQASGAHTLVAQITDSQGNTSDSPAIAITIDQFPSIASTTPNTTTAPGLSFPIQIVASASDDITTLVDSTYTWSCTANCGDSTFNRTDSNTVIWTAPSSDQGAAATIQVSVDDGVNTPVVDTVNLSYAVGTASANVVGTSTLEEVSTWAGSTSGAADGNLLNATFNLPRGIAIDSSGNIYIADSGNHVIRKIEPNGVISTFAGSGTAGFNNATGTSAQFNSPQSIAIDSSDNLYIADINNDVIRKITPAGVVTTFAGQQGSPGFADNTGTLAQFNQPHGVAIDSSDNLYVADTLNHRIRKITPAAVVTTFAGQASANLTDATGGAAQFNQPHGVDVDASDNVYIADKGNHAIRKITPAAAVTTLAGGSSGLTDGTGGAAQFNQPHDLVVDGSGNVYVADRMNHAIRKVTAGGAASTLSGNGVSGFADGLKSRGQFAHPIGIELDASGTILVVDKNNYKIRRVKP